MPSSMASSRGWPGWGLVVPLLAATLAAQAGETARQGGLGVGNGAPGLQVQKWLVG